MKKFVNQIVLAVILISIPPIVFSQTGLEKKALVKTQKFLDNVIENSYPELKAVRIRLKIFKSDSNYFKAQFSISRFLMCRKKGYLIYINPKIYRLNTPDDAIQAILAHELGHILYYKSKNRLELLGLVGLIDKSFTAKFERKADLTAIARGYGEGLKEYRKWLYENLPEKKLEGKKRDYFSPEEIDLILEIFKKNPQMIKVWRKNVPRSIEEISKSRKEN